MISRKRSFLLDFLRDENAQAVLEYILIVSVLVSIAILLIRDLIRPILDKMTAGIADALRGKIFNPETLHHSPFKK